MFRLGRTRPTRARSSGSETLSRIQFLAGFTIDMRGSSFRKRQGTSGAMTAALQWMNVIGVSAPTALRLVAKTVIGKP
jgi:hypothetical protein